MSDLQKVLESTIRSKEQFTFITKIKRSDGPSITIEKLEDLAAQDVEKWCAQFKLIMKLCGYDLEKGLKMLKMIVSYELVTCVPRKQSLETALNALIYKRYTKEAGKVWYKQLKELGVWKCKNINTYYDKFKLSVENVDLCFPAKERLNERELAEIFNNGLIYWMKEEFVRFPNASRGEIVECLAGLENFKRGNNERNPNTIRPTERRKNENRHIINNDIKSPREYTNKYLHFALNKTYDDKSKKMMIIKEVNGTPEK